MQMGLVLAVVLGAFQVHAADVAATPETYRALLGTLVAGDTLQLAAGHYPRLNIAGLNGTADAWITISGPTSGAPAVVDADACCNTVEISNSSYVAVEHVTIDGQDIDGAFAISAKDGARNRVHNIRIEGCEIINHHGSQQHNGISTKTPTWGWIVRGNRILNAGTGIYLGNSDGTFPFIGGLIENNLVENSIGYSMQIKWQLPRPDVQGMPTTPSTTIIRNNVFIKNDQPSPDGDRPNVLVGGFPQTGPGSQDRYEIYGNLFLNNPREALLQASGRVSVHDNVFVGAPTTPAILLRDHDLPLRQAWVYNNTIYGTPTGIAFGSAAPQGGAVVGNLIFAATPIQGHVTQRDNITDTVANAALYVKAPSTTAGAMDFYPLAGKATGTAIDLSAFDGDTDVGIDFNGRNKGTFTFRGAYAGEGTNPGWPLNNTIKGLAADEDDGDAGPDDGDGDAGPDDNNDGADAGSDGADAGSDDTAGADDDAAAGASDPGCSLTATGTAAGSWCGLSFAAGLALANRRRRRERAIASGRR